MLYIEEYAALIREPKKMDYEVWKLEYEKLKVDADNNLPQSKADLKTY